MNWFSDSLWFDIVETVYWNFFFYFAQKELNELFIFPQNEYLWNVCNAFSKLNSKLRVRPKETVVPKYGISNIYCTSILQMVEKSVDGEGKLKEWSEKSFTPKAG